jgi:TRAP-type mannitol/chloroaromatic compound transport system permease small subunit
MCGQGLIWLQESYIWTHVAVIVLGAGYTMMSGGFVRVDVFYSAWDVRRRALSDLVMTLVLLVPFLFIFGAGVWTFWTASYASDEGSLNPGGMGNYWILKGTLLGFILLSPCRGRPSCCAACSCWRGMNDTRCNTGATARTRASEGRTSWTRHFSAR